MLTLEPVGKLTRDLRNAAATLSAGEARFLVDSYYAMQDYRIAAANQVRALTKTAEPHETLTWFGAQTAALEAQVQKALDVYSMSRREGRWARAQYGIGPVIAAGLLAHIDPAKAHTAGAIWRYAGLDPSVTWPRADAAAEWMRDQDGDAEALLVLGAAHFGRDVTSLRRLATTEPSGKAKALTKTSLAKALARRPWNAALKVLCWKLGQSFMKFHGNEECFYGRIYAERKALEVSRNEAGDFAGQASAKLAAFKIRDADTKATYEAGRLPAGRLELRAERYAVKLFLAHFQAVMFEVHRGTAPPRPYVIERLGHAHVIAPPGWPCD